MVFVFLYHWFAIQRSYYLVKSNVFQNKKSQHPYLMTLFVSVFLFSRVLSQLVRTMLSDHPLRGPFHVTICKALLMWALADLQCCQQRRSSEGGEWMCLCMCACMGDAYMIACVCVSVCVCVVLCFCVVHACRWRWGSIQYGRQREPLCITVIHSLSHCERNVSFVVPLSTHFPFMTPSV